MEATASLYDLPTYQKDYKKEKGWNFGRGLSFLDAFLNSSLYLLPFGYLLGIFGIYTYIYIYIYILTKLHIV